MANEINQYGAYITYTVLAPHDNTFDVILTTGGSLPVSSITNVHTSAATDSYDWHLDISKNTGYTQIPYSAITTITSSECSGRTKCIEYIQEGKPLAIAYNSFSETHDAEGNIIIDTASTTVAINNDALDVDVHLVNNTDNDTDTGDLLLFFATDKVNFAHTSTTKNNVSVHFQSTSTGNQLNIYFSGQYYSDFANDITFDSITLVSDKGAKLKINVTLYGVKNNI